MLVLDPNQTTFKHYYLHSTQSLAANTRKAHCLPTETITTSIPVPNNHQFLQLARNERYAYSRHRRKATNAVLTMPSTQPRDSQGRFARLGATKSGRIEKSSRNNTMATRKDNMHSDMAQRLMIAAICNRLPSSSGLVTTALRGLLLCNSGHARWRALKAQLHAYADDERMVSGVALMPVIQRACDAARGSTPFAKRFRLGVDLLGEVVEIIGGMGDGHAEALGALVGDVRRWYAGWR